LKPLNGRDTRWSKVVSYRTCRDATFEYAAAACPDIATVVKMDAANKIVFIGIGSAP
jgi:hypothetical protein